MGLPASASSQARVASGIGKRISLAAHLSTNELERLPLGSGSHSASARSRWSSLSMSGAGKRIARNFYYRQPSTLRQDLSVRANV